MRIVGTILIIIGLIWGIIAFNIDTSIEVGGESYGSGEYAVKVPKARVNNLGLMNDKQNNISGAGVILVIGVILFIFGGRKEEENVQGSQEEFTETLIQDDEDKFKISFQMKDENSWDTIKVNLFTYYKQHNIDNVISENSTTWMLGGSNGLKGYVQATLNKTIITIECFKVQKPDISIIDSETKDNKMDIVSHEKTSTESLIALGELFEKKLITKEEFETEKKKLLST